ncbi:phosphoribosyltransferase domain-containing protein, partial [Enterobacter kobei]
LASQFPSTLTGPVLFIGMAETAVGLGAGVFDEVRHQHPESVYLTSTRHPVDGTLLCEFKEEHSHATDHLIYLPDDEEKRRRVTNARTLVLIDDEATTGNTFINLLS